MLAKRRSRSKVIPRLLLIPVMICAVSAMAQITTKGRVTDGQRGLPGASVLLLQLDSTVVSGATSDSVGVFILEPIIPGKYLISITMIGYHRLTSATISLEKDTVISTPFVLEENASLLNEVVINANKQLIEQQPDRLIVNLKNAITTGGNSVLEVLTKAPGVMVNKQNNTIVVNGRSGVKIMINDKVVQVSNDIAIQMLDGMSAANVEKIELITTPSSKFDAEGSGGIIHIVTKKSDDFGTSGSFGLSVGTRWAEATAANFVINHRKKRSVYFIEYNITTNHNLHILEIDRQLPERDFAHPVHVEGHRESLTVQQNANIGAEWSVEAHYVLPPTMYCTRPIGGL